MQVFIKCSESAARNGIWLLKLLKVCEGAEDHAAQGWSWSCGSALDMHPLFENIYPSEVITEVVF